MIGIYVFWRNGSEQAEYVGSSIKVASRIGDHICELRKGKHANPHFQNAWNKYGAASYHAIQIETCASDLVIKREQYWIDTLKPCRNIAVCADNPMRGRTASAETRAKQSVAKKGKPLSAEHRARLSVALLGAKNPNFGKHPGAETIAKLSASSSGARHYSFGKHISAEHRAKIGAAQVGRTKSADTRAKLSAAATLQHARQRFRREWMEPT